MLSDIMQLHLEYDYVWPGRSAVWLARLNGVQEVASSSLAAPTIFLCFLVITSRQAFIPDGSLRVFFLPSCLYRFCRRVILLATYLAYSSTRWPTVTAFSK